MGIHGFVSCLLKGGLFILLAFSAHYAQGQAQRTLPPESVFEQRISLDVQDADVRAVLTSLADMAKLNIVFDPEVSGRVTIHFVDVPWKTAFDTILHLKGLRAVWDGGKVARVAPLR